jgi:GT2 family glycosyltransferase
MNTARTTAVIVSYRSRDTIADTMIAAREAHESGMLECVVVDNCGSDGTAEYLEKEHAWAELLPSPENLGFGRACNLGFRRVTTEYVLLLNPDAVLPAASLEVMIRFLDEHPRAGIIGPAIREPDEGLQHAGGLPTPLRLILEAAGANESLGRRPIVPGGAAFRTDWLCGAILLFRKRLLDELNGFDPRFFLYFEETDLCLRAQQRDWELWAVGEAVGWHRNAASAGTGDERMLYSCIAEYYFRSRFYYLVKHHGWVLAIATEITEVAVLGMRCAWRRLRGRPQNEFRERLRAPILKLPPEPGR